MSKIVIGLCALLMLVITPAVHADPIVITSGFLSVSGTARASYSLTGNNFSVTGANGDTGNSPATGCLPCASGSLLSTGSFFVGTSLGHGSATINGTTFSNVGFLGEFGLGGASILLPAGTENLTITFPFTFSGNIRGCDSNVSCLNVIFSTTELVGQGIGTLELTFGRIHESGVALYDFKSLTYNFQSSEVPEPMTITLLATGLIGVGAKLRSRTRRRSQQ
jgi:hypothetical protein